MGRKLLLADDSLTIQKVVSLTFHDEAMEVTTVSSGAEALEKLAESLPDIVLADVFMPEPNGYELCARIKRDERTCHIPVLLLVGTFEPFNEAEARRVGADEVLTKPFQSIRDLVNKVGGLLGGADDKNDAHAGHAPDERRSDEEMMQELSPLAAERAADPSIVTPATSADAFSDFDMDDATIQTTPAAAFGARAHEEEASAFSEINEEKQLNERGETDGAFVLGDDAPAQEEAQAAAAAAVTSASSVSSSEVAHSGASSVFAAHATRTAEADDMLLDLGDITPAHEATGEADDFILDIGDDDAFDSPAAPSAHADAETGMLVAENPTATVATEERKLFAEPEVSESPAPSAETAPATFAPELEPAFGVMPEEAAQQPQAQWHAEASEFAMGSVPAAVAESASSMSSASSFETAGQFASEAAPVEAEGASQPVFATQESAPAMIMASSEQSQTTTASTLSPEMLDEVVRRVVAQMSEQVVREIAWEVVPELAERLIKQRLEEEKTHTP